MFLCIVIAIVIVCLSLKLFFRYRYHPIYIYMYNTVEDHVMFPMKERERQRRKDLEVREFVLIIFTVLFSLTR